MQCPHCGGEIPDSAAFCPGCGRRLADAPAQPGPRASGQPLGKSPAPPANTAAQLQSRSAQIRAAGDVAEKELWRGSYSYKAMFGTLLSAALITIVALVALVYFYKVQWFLYVDLACIILLWLIVGSTMLHRKMGIRYRLTNQRFFLERGILRRVTERIEVIDIDDLQFEQNLVERMFDVGSITLSSTDRSVPKFWLQGIEHVQEVSDLIDQARRAERNRRGLYIESS